MNLSATASPFALLANAGGVASPMGTGGSKSAFAAALLGTADAIVPPAATMALPAATVPAATGLMTTTLTADVVGLPATPLANAGPAATDIAFPLPSLKPPATVDPQPPLAPTLDQPADDQGAPAETSDAATQADQPIAAQPVVALAPSGPPTVAAPIANEAAHVTAPPTDRGGAPPAVEAGKASAPSVAPQPAKAGHARPADTGKVQPVEPSPAYDLIQRPTVCAPEPASVAPVAARSPATSAMHAAPVLTPQAEKPAATMIETGIAPPNTVEPKPTSVEPFTPHATEAVTASPVVTAELAPSPQPPISLAAAFVPSAAPPTTPAERGVPKPETTAAAPTSAKSPPAAKPIDSQPVADTPEAVAPSLTLATSPETGERGQPIPSGRPPSAEDARNFAQHIAAAGSQETSEAPRAEAPRSADPEVAARPGRIGQEMGVAIARHVSASAGETMTVRLTPADMGRIDVRLSFDENGTLRAVVAADNPASLEMLRRESADLTRALGDAGVRADGASLRFDTRSDGGGGSAGQFWQRRQDARNAASDRGANQPLPEDTPYRPLRASGRIDMMA